MNITINPMGGSWGGTTSNSVVEVTYGVNKTIAAPTRPGYDFVGWAVQNGALSQCYPTATGFFDSVPNKYIYYGGSATNNSTLTLINTTYFTSEKKRLRLTEPGTSARGVGYNKTTTAELNKVYLMTVHAKLPLGTYLVVLGNNIGSGSSYEWLTPCAGTGNWETYALKITAGSSGTTGTFGHLVVCGDTNNVQGNTNPGNITADFDYQLIGTYASIFNHSTTYVPKEGVTSDNLFALWIEKKYNIAYNLNGGQFASSLDAVKNTNNHIEALNPTSAQWNRSPYIVGVSSSPSVSSMGSGKITANTPGFWFEVNRPSKAPDVTEVTATFTTSFNAASMVHPLTSTRTRITSTPNNFYSWTITGMDSSEHHYWGRVSSSATTNTDQSFTSTSKTLTGTNSSSGLPPVMFGNLRQTPGNVTFTAGWTPGTPSNSTVYSSITLPTVPTKGDETTDIIHNISFNANGGNCPTTSMEAISRTITSYSKDSKWYTSSAYTTVAGTQGTTYTPTISATLHAKYTASSNIWRFGITLPTPTHFIKSFTGWYDSNNTFLGKGGDFYLATNSATLTAHWVDKYFVIINSNNEWKKYVPYILSNGAWKPSRAYVNTGTTNGWKPCGEIPTEDGYTHVTIVDTQNFTIPNRDWEIDDDDGISLTKSSEFTNRMTSHQAFVDFFSECKRILVTIDGEVSESISTLEDIAGPYDGGWVGYDYHFSTPVSGFSFRMWDYNENIYNWGDWGSYKGGTHSIKIEALL